MAHLQLLVGRAGTGKTRALCQLIRKAIDEDAVDRSIVVVPTRADARRVAEDLVSLIGKAHDPATVTLGLRIETLPGLAHRVFDGLGLPAPKLLPSSLRPVLLVRALRQVAEDRPDLAIPNRQIDERGPLTEFLGEAIRARVHTPELKQAVERLISQNEPGSPEQELARRVAWLAAVMERYDELCRAIGRVDPDRLAATAADALRRARTHNPIALRELGIDRLFLDGFARFGEGELGLLDQLIQRAQVAAMTLTTPTTLDDDSPSAEASASTRAFTFTQRTVKDLRPTGFATGGGGNRPTIKISRHGSPHRLRDRSLRHLERELFRTTPAGPTGRPVELSDAAKQDRRAARDELARTRSIQRISAPTVADEADAIAGEVRRLHREEGVPLTDIGLYVRNGAAYGPLLADAFARAEVPLAMPLWRTLGDTPEWWFTRDLLAVVAESPAEPGTAWDLVRNPLLPLDGSAMVQSESRAIGLRTNEELLDPELYESDEAKQLIAPLRAAVDELRRLWAAGTADDAAPTPVQVLQAVRRVIRRLGLFAPPIHLPGRRRPTGAIIGDPAVSMDSRVWFDPSRADSIRERSRAQWAIRSLLDDTIRLLAEPGLQAALAPPADADPDAPADGVPAAIPAAADLGGVLTDAVEGRHFRIDDPQPRTGVWAGELRTSGLRHEFPIVFIAGLMQGTFPPPPSADAVLSDRDRRRLTEVSPGVYLEERASQREYEDFLFYTGVTRARDRLYVGHSERDAAGKEALPSLYLRDVAAAFGMEMVQLPTIGPPMVTERASDRDQDAAEDLSRTDDAKRGAILWRKAEEAWQAIDRPADPSTNGHRSGAALEPESVLDATLTALAEDEVPRLPWQVLRTPDALLRWTVRQLWRRRAITGEAIAAWQAARVIWNRWPARRDALRHASLPALRDPHRPLLSDEAREWIRTHPRFLSASGMNTFANCPYKYYAHYHLGLDEPQLAEPDAATWGSLHHLVLEELGKGFLDGSLRPDPDEAEAWAADRIIELAYDPVQGFPRMLTQARFRTELKMQQDKLRQFVRADTERRAHRGTVPIGFEVPFGFNTGDPDEKRPEICADEPLIIHDEDGRELLRLRGYIDLMEAEPQRDLRGRHWAVIVDYKSGGVAWRMRGLEQFFDDETLDRESLVPDGYQGPDQGKALDFQLPIYVMAAQRLLQYSVAATFFYSIADKQKRGIYLLGKHELLASKEYNSRDERPQRIIDDLVERAERMLRAMGKRLLGGDIAINPNDCNWCDYRDVCRFHKAQEDVRVSRDLLAGSREKDRNATKRMPRVSETTTRVLRGYNLDEIDLDSADN